MKTIEKLYINLLLSYKFLLIGIVLDVIFTAISYNLVGSWAFEANGLILHKMHVVVAINIITLLCAARSYGVRFLYNIMRLVALVSHPILWITLSIKDNMNYNEPMQTNIPLALIFPVVIMIGECVYRKHFHDIVVDKLSEQIIKVKVID